MASSRVLSTVSLFPIEMDTHYIPRLTSVTSTRSESKNTFCRFVELFDNGRRRYRIALSKRLPTQNSTLYCVGGGGGNSPRRVQGCEFVYSRLRHWPMTMAAYRPGKNKEFQGEKKIGIPSSFGSWSDQFSVVYVGPSYSQKFLSDRESQTSVNVCKLPGTHWL